jgi:hypothetical protein
MTQEKQMYEFKYEPDYQMRQINRYFVTDQEIQLMLDLFNRKIVVQHIQLYWRGMQGCTGIAASFHCNEDIPANRFANLHRSENPPYNWSCFSSGKAGISEVVWVVERDFQLNAGLACWASDDEEDIGYSEEYDGEGYPPLLPVTYERIMRLPAVKRIDFMSKHDNFRYYKQREIIGLDQQKIDEILDISSVYS